VKINSEKRLGDRVPLGGGDEHRNFFPALREERDYRMYSRVMVYPREGLCGDREVDIFGAVAVELRGDETFAPQSMRLFPEHGSVFYL